MSGTPRRLGEQDNILPSVNDLLIGVLFLFIILMMTFALQFSDKREALEQLSVARINERTALLKRLKTRLDAAGSPVAIDQGAGVLRFGADLLFKENDATLQPAGWKALRTLATALTEELPCFAREAQAARCGHDRHPILEAVYVEGHTDVLPPRRGGRFRTNWELSSARAIAAYEGLRTLAPGLPVLENAQGQSMLGVSAYAEQRQLPHASLQANRRVEFRFLLAPPSPQEIASATAREAS